MSHGASVTRDLRMTLILTTLAMFFLIGAAQILSGHGQPR